MTELYMAKTDLLADNALYESLYQSLPDWRKKKAERLKRLCDKHRSVLAWHVLSYAMKQRGFSQKQLEITFDSLGKPCFKHLPHVYFNLSHSAGRVLCGISDSEIGCDTERKREIDFKLADRFFSPKEREILMGITDADIKRHTFFRLWTLKESVVKAMGSSVLSTRELTVNLEATPISVEPNPMITRALFLHEFDFGDDYCYGCCTTEADSVNICEVDISQLA